MNLFSRGVRNAFRNTIRTSSIVIILALSIGLTIAMLAARQAVTDKIASVKSSVGTTISISPAGFRGFEGGGTALTSAQLAKAAATAHITKVTQMLNDRLSANDTSLQSAIEAGVLGQRFGSGSGTDTVPQLPADTNTSSSTDTTVTTRSFTPPVTVTGANDLTGTAAFGGSTAKITSGSSIDASSNEDIALVGKALAAKNNLSVGSTFTAYGATITVKGIFDTGTTFGNGGVIVPLATLQRLSSQAGSVTSAVVTVDSLDNLSSTTTAIKTALGSAADVTNSQDLADQTVQPLESVKNISLFSLVGALVAGAVIILLTMMMIVRERRREIGVMKAIGASNVTIMAQFIVEALTLTVLGLILGTLVGVAAASPVTKTLVTNSSSSQTQSFGGAPGGSLPSTARPAGGPGLRTFGHANSQTLGNITASVGGGTLALGVVAALCIAIIGSAVPSFLISKIKPVEAMRSE
jgi:putative ABC transport system permease protein